MRLAPAWHVANTFWLLFFVAGATTRYWLDTPVWFRLLGADILPVIALGIWGESIVASVRASRMRSALWVAFVFSVPYLVYDALYFRGYLGLDWSYLLTWWHLPLFSVLVWAVVPWWLRK